MEKRWDGYVYLGIVYPKLFEHANSGEGPITETLSKLLYDSFFTAVEVAWIRDEATRKRVRDMLKASQMEVLYNGAPPIRGMGINLCSLDADLRKRSVDNFKKVIDEAYFLGAKVLHCVSGNDPGPSKRAEAKRNLVDSLRQLCRYAQVNSTDYTLMVSLENSDRDVDRKALLGPTTETVEVAREVHRDFKNFGILLDQGHFPLMKEDPRESLHMCKDLLTHVHIGNCYSRDSSKPYFGDKHLPFGFPDSDVGVEELKTFLRILKDIGFFERTYTTKYPVLSFEVGPVGDMSPELVIANVKRVFSQSWALF
jgi:sugar phosphate isomerase/epimerase